MNKRRRQPHVTSATAPEPEACPELELAVPVRPGPNGEIVPPSRSTLAAFGPDAPRRWAAELELVIDGQPFDLEPLAAGAPGDWTHALRFEDRDGRARDFLVRCRDDKADESTEALDGPQ